MERPPQTTRAEQRVSRAPDRPASGAAAAASAHPVIALQRGVGNQAAGRIIQAKLRVGPPGEMLQMQSALKQKPPTKKTGNLTFELLQQSFHKMLLKRRLTEAVHGSMAHEIASAYVQSRSPATIIATPYGLKDLDFRIKASHTEVYEAILNHMAKTGTGNQATDWQWTQGPAPSKTGTRRETVVEVSEAIQNEALGDLKDKARDYAIEKVAVRCAATWSAAEGLVVVAEMVVGALGVIGYFSLVASALELLILLQKPVETMTREERIISDVRGWLHMRKTQAQLLAEGARKQAEFQKSLKKPINNEIYIMPPVSTRVAR